MAKIQFSNDASSLLATQLNPGDTTIQVASGEGAFFPSPVSGQYFVVALRDASANLEICHCTARSGDLLTVTRAQEGTSALTWAANTSRCELRLTKGTMEEFIQRSGDNMTGDLAMASNKITDAELTGSTVITGGQTVGTAIRGALNDSSNEITVPSDGSKALASGSPIVTQSDNLLSFMPSGAIIMWYGSQANIPSGWFLCDGNNGTPDLTDKFIKGAGGSLALGDTGGTATATTSTDSHSHGSTDAHQLTISEMPSHSHIVYSNVVQSDGGNPFTTNVVDGVGTYSAHTSTEGGDQAHSHTIPTGGAHSHTVNNDPEYHAVYFIMKV